MIARLTALARRALGSVVVRAVITAALLWLVLSKLDWDEIGDKISSGDPVYGVLAVLCVVAALVIGGIRWDVLLRVADIHLPGREIARIYAVTSFANAFLPTSVGGDVARPLMVTRRGPVLVRAITTVLVERLVALIALLGLAWVGVALVPSAVSDGSFVALSVFSAGLVAGTLVLLLRPALLGRMARALVPARYASSVSEVGVVVRALAGRPGAVVVIVLQSVAFQALVTMQLVFLARMIGADLSFGLAAVALALVTLAMLAPISIGGFGVREGSYVVILAGGGIGQTDAVLISLLSVATLFIATLPGAYELIRGGFSPALRAEGEA